MITQQRNARKQRRGFVVSRGDKSIVVQLTRRIPHPLYRKLINKRSRVMAHDEKNECGIGDEVVLMETRPLSKRKCWRLIEILCKKR